MKKNVAFTLISFAVLKWDDCLSVQVPFELPVQIPVQLLLELEANWIDQNVNELEFELSRMYMKQPYNWTDKYHIFTKKILHPFVLLSSKFLWIRRSVIDSVHYVHWMPAATEKVLKKNALFPD